MSLFLNFSTRKSILIIIRSLILCLLLSGYHVITLDCNPYAIHITLGPYYQNFNANETYSLTTLVNGSMVITPDLISQQNQTANVLFQTNDACTNIRLGSLVNGTMLSVFNSSPTIERYDFQTSLNVNQSKYIYNISIPITSTNISMLFNYSIVNLESNNEYMILQNFSSKMPIRDLNVNSTQQSKFVFVGMMDNSIYSQPTFNRLQQIALNTSQNKSSVDCIFYLGDMAFNLQDDNFQKGDTFLNKVETWATYIPLMTTPGSLSSFDNFLFYNTMFKTTTNQKNGLFYSFNVGNVHFIQINMAFFLQSNLTYQTVINGYLKNDLTTANSQANRKQRPWIFVYGYGSLYCSLETDNNCKKMLADNAASLSIMETTLYYNKVDIFFSSQNFFYQRSKPLYQNQIQTYDTILVNNISSIFNPTGVVYIVEGVGGNPQVQQVNQNFSSNFLVSSIKIGYGVLTVINTTHFFYEHIDASTGLAVDQFYFINELQKWNQQWTPQQESIFVVCSVLFVFFGVLAIGAFQIYVDSAM